MTVDWTQNLAKNSKPEFKKEELGREFVKEFKRIYSFYQYNTPHIAQAILHLTLGQIPSIKKMSINIDANYLDTRIHVVWFQQAATGKGRGYNFSSILANGLGLTFKPVHEITDGALVGGYRSVQKYDAAKKRRSYEYEFIPGALQKGRYNIVAMNEAGMLFNLKPNQIQKNAMDYYQISMNTMGTADNIIAKDVLHGGGTIYCEPDCSLFLSSYIPVKFNQVVATRGFASRTLNIINDISSENKHQAMQHSAKFFNIKREEAEYGMTDIVNKLNFINLHYRGIKQFKSDKNIQRPLANLISQIQDSAEEVNKFHRRKLEEFMHRYQDVSFKLIYHGCCLRLGSKIEDQDVAYAEEFIMPIWRQFITYLEESMEQNFREQSKEMRIEHDIYDTYNRIHGQKKYSDANGYVPRPLLKKFLQYKVWRCSSSTADKRIKMAEQSDLLSKSKKGKVPTIKAIRKPYD